MCPQRINIDAEYVTASMREIAKFHGAGYVLKKEHPEQFGEIVGKLREPKLHRGRFESFVNLVSTRAVDYLRSINYDLEFCDKMHDRLSQAFEKGCLECVEPVGPLATICHGDFLRNNVLFKKENKEDLQGMLIDFATVRYATPASDLATFFYLSCSKVDRVNKFGDHFGVYCDTLHRFLEESGVDLGDFSKEALMEDYKKNAIYGFVIATFFLPMMMFPPENFSIEEFFQQPVEESAAFQSSLGGGEMTRILADMLLELREAGCLEKFLK